MMAIVKRWTWIFALLVFSCTLQAMEQESYLDIDGGYRWDKINNRVVLSGPTFGVVSSTQAARGLNSLQLGGRGRLLAGSCGFFLQGAGHYGWIDDGSYTEASFFGRARGHTIDGIAGIGWFTDMHKCWALAPSVGWSYDQIAVTGKNIFVPIPTLGVVSIGDIQYQSTFQGPWAGLGLFFAPTKAVEIDCTYQLHHARWTGTRYLATELGPTFGTTTGFSNRRTHDNIWGHVFEIDAVYGLCTGWEVGLDLKYQIWKSQGTGLYRRTITPVIPAITSQLVTDVEWESFSAMIHVGYFF